MSLLKITDRCPYIITKAAGDESQDYCDFNDVICSKVSGAECNIYNEWIEEKDASK